MSALGIGDQMFHDVYGWVKPAFNMHFLYPRYDRDLIFKTFFQSDVRQEIDRNSDLVFGTIVDQSL